MNRTRPVLEYAVTQGNEGRPVSREGMSKLALSRGLLFTAAVAETWLQKQRHREDVLHQMHGAGYSLAAARLHPVNGTEEQRAHSLAAREELALPRVRNVDVERRIFRG